MEVKKMNPAMFKEFIFMLMIKYFYDSGINLESTNDLQDFIDDYIINNDILEKNK